MACIAHCASSDLGMGRELASALACSYPELQQMRKMPLNPFPPGSLVTYFDQQHQSFIYNLLTKRLFFHKPTIQTLELSLQALNQNLKVHIFQEHAIPIIGCGYD